MTIQLSDERHCEATEQSAPRHSFGVINLEQRRLRIDTADEILAGHIHRSLIATGRRQLSELKVTVQQGRVRMAGIVNSYYAKQIAHHAALSVDGIEHFDSEIDVE